MKIIFAEPLGVAQTELEKIKTYFENKGHSFVYYSDRKEGSEEIIKRASEADILTISNIPLGKDIISKCQNLKLINVAFTRYDHIDIEYCKNQGISVCNAAGYSTPAVAELSLSLAINLYRKILDMDKNTRIPTDRKGLLGQELFGKTVGIIGAGVIGLATAKLFHTFGCKIIAYSRTLKKIDWIDFVNIDKLLQQSDIVSLHIPSNAETSNFIDKEKLHAMKKSAILINTARGAIIDSLALSNALKNNEIAGAAIDVYEKEPPLPIDHPLLDAPNTILLPHIAYATKESMLRRLEIVKSNIDSFLSNNLNNKVV